MKRRRYYLCFVRAAAKGYADGEIITKPNLGRSWPVYNDYKCSSKILG